MALRDLFGKIFGTEKNVSFGSNLQLLSGYVPIFTRYNGHIYDDAMVRACIDTIARNGAKLSPKHIRQNSKEYSIKHEKLARIISEQPNPIMNAYDFYYKVITELYLNNNAFVFIQRGSNYEVTGLYPLTYSQVKLMEYKNDVYVQFVFQRGQVYTASLANDVIHLKRFFCENDVMGASVMPIVKTMSIKHVVREGIVNAIKMTQSIKGYLKTTKSILKPEDIKRTRDQFVSDFINSNGSNGIAGLDATTDFTPVNLNPQTATDSQIKEINDEIKAYFGVNDEIIQSKYTEDQWNAFYESVLEGIAIQLGLEFTNKLFTISERYHGNKIVFESNRLQYASNQTKIQIIKEAGALGLLTINECREIMNLAPIEGGDIRVQSLNYTDKGAENE